jgi:hypothetical protein
MRIIPKAWYSWNFDVVGGDRTLATLDLSCWREKADVRIEDVTHRVFREQDGAAAAGQRLAPGYFLVRACLMIASM